MNREAAGGLRDYDHLVLVRAIANGLAIQKAKMSPLCAGAIALQVPGLHVMTDASIARPGLLHQSERETGNRDELAEHQVGRDALLWNRSEQLFERRYERISPC